MKNSRLADFIRKFYTVVLLLFAIPILCLLLFYAFNGTCHITVDEVTLFVEDSIWLNFIYLIVFLIILWLARKLYCNKLDEQNKLDDLRFRKIYRALIAICVVFSLTWILATQYLPFSDSKIIQDTIEGINIGELSAFSKGGYIAWYPHNVYITIFYYLLSLLFGVQNYIVLQMVNVVALIVLVLKMDRILELLDAGYIVRLIFPVLMIFFFPATLYCSFLYGNMIGLSLAVCGIQATMDFWLKKDIKNGACAIIFIISSIALKSIFLIVLVAVILLDIFQILNKKSDRRSYAVFLLMLVVTYVFFQSCWKIVALIVPRLDLTCGQSYWAHLAMGLQPSDLAPGWYNAYNYNTFIQSGYDTKVHTSMAFASIKESVVKFASDTKYAIEFFTEKIASQWNNPTFQGFWIGQYAGSNIKQSSFILLINSLQGQRIISAFLNIYQVIVLFGSLLYMLIIKKGENFLDRMLPMLTFVGGFIFLILWEGKSQYAFLFYIFLFPYMVLGYRELLYAFEVGNSSNSLIVTLKKPLKNKVFIYMLICVIAISIFYSIDGRMTYLNKDTENYRQMLVDDNELYRAKNFVSPGWHVMSNGGYSTNVELSRYQSKYRIQLQDGTYITKKLNTEYEISTIECVLSSRQEWTIIAEDEHFLLINRDRGQYLAYSETDETLYLSDNRDNEDCMWLID